MGRADAARAGDGGAGGTVGHPRTLTTLCFFCSFSRCSTTPSSATSNGVWPWQRMGREPWRQANRRGEHVALSDASHRGYPDAGTRPCHDGVPLPGEAANPYGVPTLNSTEAMATVLTLTAGHLCRCLFPNGLNCCDQVEGLLGAPGGPGHTCTKGTSRNHVPGSETRAVSSGKHQQ